MNLSRALLFRLATSDRFEHLVRSLPGDKERAYAAANIPIRLVKGAYVEPRAVARPWCEEADIAFLQLAHQLGAAGADFVIATHDPVLREALLATMPALGIEMLLGVRSQDALALTRRGSSVRLYVPFGRDWFRYWMRRVAEARGT